jgi:hypothetical protein
LPAAGPLQDRIEFPEPPVIVAGDRVQARFVELVVTVRVTVPINPFCDDTVMVELPATPALTVRVDGLADIVKSWTGIVTL